MFHVQYHGYVSIDFWEYILGLFYLVILYAFFARRKRIEIKTAPEYKYFLWGLFAKVFGGLIFSLIYFYYYQGGDTIAYFYSAVSMSKLATIDPTGFFTVLFGEIEESKRDFFNEEIGFPYRYVYFDPRTFFVIRFISPLVFISLNSYLITTLLLASISYIGVWKCYRTVVSYYPSLMNKFAIAFLFMPSIIFWGSAILKDTFTFSATCWFVHSLDEIINKRRKIGANVLAIFVCSAIIIIVKPYIFMVLFPAALLWMFHSRITAIRSVLVKFIFVPLGAMLVLTATAYTLTSLEGSLDKFSMDKALKTIEVSQEDLTRVDSYGSNYFEIGELDGTWGGVLAKFPIAVNAALFRPYLWEAPSVVILLSALENFWLLIMAVITLFKARTFLIRVLFGESRVMFFMLFALSFAFVVGVTTPNFGALVRFKIPMIPFFVASMYLIRFLTERKRMADRNGLPFSLSYYKYGDPFRQTTTKKGTSPSTRRGRAFVGI